MKYYLTYYEAYPIYEAAEGGYYYEGREAIEWMYSENLKEILDYIPKAINNYGFEFFVKEDYYENRNQFDNEIIKDLEEFGDILIAVESSKYIGDNKYLYLEIESKFKSNESHWHPYE